MNYIKNLLKSFIFKTEAIEELSECRFLYYVLTFVLCEVLTAAIGFSIITEELYLNFLVVLACNFVTIVFRILIMFLFVKKTRRNFLLITQAFLINFFMSWYMTLITTDTFTVKVLSVFIILYTLYYVYKYLKINIPYDGRFLVFFILLANAGSKFLVSTLYTLVTSLMVK